MASEGTRLAPTGDARRLLLASLALEHRLAPRDPLAAPDAAFEAGCAAALLTEEPVALADVARLVEPVRN